MLTELKLEYIDNVISVYSVLIFLILFFICAISFEIIIKNFIDISYWFLFFLFQYSCHSFTIWSVIVTQSNQATDKAKTYKRFRESIKPCPAQKYELSPSDVCARTKQCRNKMHLFNFRFDACPCRNHFRYSCGNGKFCTVNKKTCDILINQMKNNRLDDNLKRLNTCWNVSFFRTNK